MAENKHDVTTSLGWLEKLLQLYKEYGTFSIIKGLVLLILLSYTLRICYNPSFIFDKYDEYQRSKHAEELAIRQQLDKEVKSLLPKYLSKYQADRVWIIQYHNGVMDWQHGTMRFEYCRNGVSSILYQYNNFNLTWLNLPYYLAEKEIYIGSTEEVKDKDTQLYYQLIKNGVNYLACAALEDSNGTVIGVFGVTWNDIPEDIEIKKYRIRDYLFADKATISLLTERRKPLELKHWNYDLEVEN